MIDTFAPPGATPVPLDHIDSALRALWCSIEPQTTEAPPTGLNDPVPSVTRAVALNLVVYAPGPRAVDRATKAAQELALGHPCRTIILDVTATDDTGDESPLATAEVLAHCQPRRPGESRICAEQLTLHLHGAVVPHLDKIVLPLLVPDLKTVLWWMGNVPFDAPFYGPLSRLVDQMVVDGTTYDDAEAFLVRLAHMVISGEGPEVRGLGWARLTPWRRLIAQFFDSDRNRPYLDRIDRIHLRHHDMDDNPDRVEPLLLVAWLASRLDWKPTGSDGDRFGFTAPDGRTVEVLIEPIAEPGRHGLTSVELAVGDERRFQVERWQDDTCLRTRVEGGEMAAIERVTTAPLRDAADLIGEELEILPRDLGLEAALVLIPEMIGAK